MDVRMVQIEKMPQEFEDARTVLQQIENAGYEAYFVGGSVRDTLLNKKIHDVDIASSAYPAEIKQIFKKTIDTGIEHGTVMVIHDGNGYEVTTFRTESGYQDFRRPDKVTFVRSLKEDLMRRDFTINALALREDRTIIDIFDGVDDLNKKIIKAVGDPHERFHEDALRMMRAVRFASQLDFVINKQTLSAISENNYLLAKISVERTLVEFQKMMLGQNPNRGLIDMLGTGLSEYCPGFKNQKNKLRKLTDLKLNQLANEEQVWTLITWLLEIDQTQITSFLKRWKTSNDVIKSVIATTSVLEMQNDVKVDRMRLFKAGKINVQNAIQVSGILGKDQTKWMTVYSQLQVKNTNEIAITGKDLIKAGVVKPGPEMGIILNRIKEMIINDQVQNEHTQLLKLANTIQKDSRA